LPARGLLHAPVDELVERFEQFRRGRDLRLHFFADRLRFLPQGLLVVAFLLVENDTGRPDYLAVRFPKS